MPILLDTPHTYSPGHGAAPVVSAMVEVVGMNVQTTADVMLLSMQYGNHDGTSWTPGPEAPHVIKIRDVPAVVVVGFDAEGAYGEQEQEPADLRFTDLIASALTSAAGTPVWGEVQYALYNWLLTHGPEDGASPAYYVGTPLL